MSTVWAVSGVVIREMYRRKDFYVLLILTALITGLMASVTFFHDDSIVRYLKEICLDLIWISSLVIAISAMARQIPVEREQRTIFPLLAKPVSRAQLLAGKFLGCWLACGIALMCFYVFLGAVSFSREHHVFPVFYFQAVTLHWAMLAILLGMVLLGSLVFAAPSSNGTICFVVAVGILFLGRYLNRVAGGLSEPGHSIVYGIYYVIPHLELFNVSDLAVHDWPNIPWVPYLVDWLYAAFYTSLFFAAAALVFRRKSLHQP